MTAADARQAATVREARRRGARVWFHQKSGTVQIDGHRWDRWADMNGNTTPTPLVVKSGGITRVSPDIFERITLDS